MQKESVPLKHEGRQQMATFPCRLREGKESSDMHQTRNSPLHPEAVSLTQSTHLLYSVPFFLFYHPLSLTWRTLLAYHFLTCVPLSSKFLSRRIAQHWHHLLSPSADKHRRVVLQYHPIRTTFRDVHQTFSGHPHTQWITHIQDIHHSKSHGGT